MVQNVIKSWKTTILGLLVIGTALLSTIVKDVSWTEASIGLVIGIGLLFCPDMIVTILINQFKKKKTE